MNTSPNNLEQKINTTAKKTFSALGFYMCALLLSSLAAQFVMIYIAQIIGGKNNWLVTSSWGNWILSFAPIYFVAYPLLLILLKKLPSTKPIEEKLGIKKLLSYLAVSVCLMYIGSYIGTFLSAFLSNGNSVNTLGEVVSYSNIVKIALTVVIAPIIEEYIFRKQLIDKTHIFGEKTAVMLSGIMFGLIHTNMYQFFYAFLLGSLFAYIYTRTGRLRYSVTLHMFINFMGSVVAPYVLSKIDSEKINELYSTDLSQLPAEELNKIYTELMPGMVMSLAYTAIMGGLAFIGFFILFRKKKNTIWKQSILELPDETRATTVYMSKGIIAFITIAVSLTVVSVFL